MSASYGVPLLNLLWQNDYQILSPSRSKSGNHMVYMIGFTEFRAGIRTKHVRK